MSHPNTAYAMREPDNDAPATSVLSPGVELLVVELGSSLQDGQARFAELIAARDAGDKEALRRIASRLVIALSGDPKALARKIALLVTP